MLPRSRMLSDRSALIPFQTAEKPENVTRNCCKHCASSRDLLARRCAFHWMLTLLSSQTLQLCGCYFPIPYTSLPIIDSRGDNEHGSETWYHHQVSKSENGLRNTIRLDPDSYTSRCQAQSCTYSQPWSFVPKHTCRSDIARRWMLLVFWSSKRKEMYQCVDELKEDICKHKMRKRRERCPVSVVWGPPKGLSSETIRRISKFKDRVLHIVNFTISRWISYIEWHLMSSRPRPLTREDAKGSARSRVPTSFVVSYCKPPFPLSSPFPPFPGLVPITQTTALTRDI